MSWEVCRIALHCNIDISGNQVGIEIGEDWRDHNVLRAKLKENCLFANKVFPSENDDAAWKAALDSGRKGEKAVSYSIDFSYKDGPAKPLYDVHLRPLVLDLSHRMHRRFGADRWLEVNMPSPATDPPLKSIGRLSKPAARHNLLCGHIRHRVPQGGYRYTSVACQKGPSQERRPRAGSGC